MRCLRTRLGLATKTQRALLAAQMVDQVGPADLVDPAAVAGKMAVLAIRIKRRTTKLAVVPRPQCVRAKQLERARDARLDCRAMRISNLAGIRLLLTTSLLLLCSGATAKPSLADEQARQRLQLKGLFGVGTIDAEANATPAIALADDLAPIFGLQFAFESHPFRYLALGGAVGPFFIKADSASKREVVLDISAIAKGRLPIALGQSLVLVPYLGVIGGLSVVVPEARANDDPDVGVGAHVGPIFGVAVEFFDRVGVFLEGAWLVRKTTHGTTVGAATDEVRITTKQFLLGVGLSYLF